MSTTKPDDVSEKKPAAPAVRHPKVDRIPEDTPRVPLLPVEPVGDPAIKPIQPSPRVEGDLTPAFDPSVRPSAPRRHDLDLAKAAGTPGTPATADRSGDLFSLWQAIDDLVYRGGDSYATRVAIQTGAREVLSRLLGEAGSEVVEGKLVTK